MCGRYALYGPQSRLREAFMLEFCPEYFARYNIAPQSRVLIIRHKPDSGRVGQLVRWGLIPSWTKDPGIGARLNNARGETVAGKPAFRSSFARHRCLIPANGFYEWQAVAADGKMRKQPWFVRPADSGSFFAFAGLLATWKTSADETIITTCIITTAANALMAPIHDRMPAILRPEQYDVWLDPANNDTGSLQAMIGPCCSEAMCASPVSPAINRGDVEGPQCIEPVAVAIGVERGAE